MRPAASLLGLALMPLLAVGASRNFTVKEDGYPLRPACSGNDEPLAKLHKGDPVKIRFALAGNGGAPCYAVSVEVDGRKLQGYVSAEGLEGLEELERERRSASTAALARLPAISRSEVAAVREKAVQDAKIDFALAAQLNLAADALQSGRPAEAEKILAKVTAPRGQRNLALLRAYALLELNQPDRAMDILEPALRENKKEPRLLALAGRAAYGIDDPARALAYWRDSLELRPDPSLEAILRRVEKEVGADKSAEKTYGMRFLLRYDGAVASPELARGMVAVLEEEFSRISFQLGCPAEERVVTIVQSRDAYYNTTGSAAWSGGQFDGKIRIPLAPAKQIDPETRRAFAHEIVHACLSNIGRWPVWLHEGMAQKLSGETLSPARREALKTLARAGKLPKLEALGGGWTRLSAAQAGLAYGLALEAVNLFFEKHGTIGPRNLMNNPQTLEPITAELDRGLEEKLKTN